MQPGQLTQTEQRDISYHKASCSAIKARVKEEWGDIWRDSVCLLKKPLCTIGLALGWEVVNRFIVLLSSRAQFLLYLINRLYLNLLVLTLLSFWFCPPSLLVRVSEWLCCAELLLGLKQKELRAPSLIEFDWTNLYAIKYGKEILEGRIRHLERSLLIHQTDSYNLRAEGWDSMVHCIYSRVLIYSKLFFTCFVKTQIILNNF